MPKTPIMKSARINMDAGRMPSRSIENAGMVHKAMANLGGTALQISTELYKRQVKEDLINDVYDKDSKFKQDLSGLELSLQNKYQNSDHKNYSIELRKGIEDLNYKYNESLDTEQKRNLFKQKTIGTVTSSLINGEQYENRSRRKYYTNIMAQNIDKIGGMDVQTANSEIRKYQLLADSTEYLDTNTHTAMMKKLDNASLRTYGALLSNKQFDMAENMLENKLKGTEDINKRLSDYSKDVIRAKIENGRKSESNKYKAGIIQDINFAKKALLSESSEKVAPYIESALMKKEFLPKEQQRAIDEDITKIKILNEFKNTMSDVPPHKRDVKGFAGKVNMLINDDPLLASATEYETHKMLTQYNEHEKKLYKRDPLSYLMKADSNLQNLHDQIFAIPDIVGPPTQTTEMKYQQWKTAINAKYDEWETPYQDRVYFSRTMQNAFIDPIEKLIKNPDMQKNSDLQIDNLIGQINSFAGEDTAMLLRQSGAKPNVVALAHVNPNSRVSAIRNMLYPIDKNTIPGYNEKYAKEELIRNDMYDIAVEAGGNSKRHESIYDANGMLDLVEKEYRYQTKNGKANPNEAWSNLFGDKGIMNNARFKMAVPAGYNVSDVASYLEQKVLDTKNERVKSTYKWVMTPDMKGTMLLYEAGGKFYTYSANKKDPYIINFDEMELSHGTSRRIRKLDILKTESNVRGGRDY